MTILRLEQQYKMVGYVVFVINVREYLHVHQQIHKCVMGLQNNSNPISNVLNVLTKNLYEDFL